uniref:Slc26a-10 n=1 Tax=Schmidtea mediterranea TaxID=79327 RepID=A0A0H3YJF3_SCHMD|nr:slc26a-10 [Schmidtea mediterranea]
MASLVSCILMMLVLLFLGPLFEPLPKCVLAAIIVASLKGILSQVKELPRLYNLSKLDFEVWIVSFVATILLNVPYGLFVGFIFSLMTVYMRFHNPKSSILGKLPHTNIYQNVKTYKDAIEIPGIKIFRYEAPIYFANADHFQNKLIKKVRVDPRILTDLLSSPNSEVYKTKTETSMLRPVEKTFKDYESNNNLKFIILDFRPVNYVDNVAVRALSDIYKLYKEIGVFVYIAEPNFRVKKLLTKSGFAKDHIDKITFVTIHDAVLKILSTLMYLDKM